MVKSLSMKSKMVVGKSIRILFVSSLYTYKNYEKKIKDELKNIQILQ